MRVTLKHSGSGRIKTVETGWSWSLFLGAGALGLPLFFRGMALWGSVMVVLWSFQLAEPFLVVDGDADTLDWILTLAVAGLCLFLGLKGNALTARHYLACGYEFAEPESTEARLAAQSWGLQARLTGDAYDVEIIDDHQEATTIRVHPGRILTREMAARGLTGNALALKLRVPANRISEIVNGKRGISAETALRLGRYFGTGPELWVRLQADYDLAEVEREMGATVRREVETGCRLSFSTPIGPTRNSAPGCPPARAARAPRVSWTWAGSRRWPTVLQHP